MSGLNYALRVLKSVFGNQTESLEAYLADKAPQNSAELNYWIDQYEHYQQQGAKHSHQTMV